MAVRIRSLLRRCLAFGANIAILRSELSSERFMARYNSVPGGSASWTVRTQLANDGIEAESAHDWPEAIRLLHEAIAACGDCQAKADLHGIGVPLPVWRSRQG